MRGRARLALERTLFADIWLLRRLTSLIRPDKIFTSTKFCIDFNYFTYFMTSSKLPRQWLSLSEAARRLDVHATTLRRWADNGEIAVMLTPGGHRRFAPADIEAFARARRGLRRRGDIEQIWADRALAVTRQEIVVRQNDQWLAHLDEASRARNRVMGRQLMALTMRYIADEEDETLLDEAYKMGLEYGRHCQASGMPLTAALQAAIFFRDMLIETALQLPENIRVRSEASLRLLRRINTLLNTVHLAIAEVYDA